VQLTPCRPRAPELRPSAVPERTHSASMLTKSILKQQPWSYTLYGSDIGPVLSVVCGGAGLFELNIPLTPDEFALANGDEDSLMALVRTVTSAPDSYASRSIAID
jgi:hypothetical protein